MDNGLIGTLDMDCAEGGRGKTPGRLSRVRRALAEPGRSRTEGSMEQRELSSTLVHHSSVSGQRDRSDI